MWVVKCFFVCGDDTSMQLASDENDDDFISIRSYYDFRSKANGFECVVNRRHMFELQNNLNATLASLGFARITRNMVHFESFKVHDKTAGTVDECKKMFFTMCGDTDMSLDHTKLELTNLSLDGKTGTKTHLERI